MVKKLLIILAIVLVASIAQADDVSFLWDANTDANLVGYRIYRRTATTQFIRVGGVACAPNDAACCTFTEFNVPDGTYFWIARAVDSDDLESPDSVELTRTLPYTPPVIGPAQVQGFRFN